MANNLLKGKRGIIFGALDEKSIAWVTAEKVHEEGGQFILTNAPIAMRMGRINELAEKCNSHVIPADATSLEDIENLYKESMEIMGGKIDFILHSIGMRSKNMNDLTMLIDLGVFHPFIRLRIKSLNTGGAIHLEREIVLFQDREFTYNGHTTTELKGCYKAR